MTSPAAIRIREPQRDGRIVWILTEDSLPPSHPARLLWELLGTLDLSAFTADSKATSDNRGRSNHSPRMLLTLWLYGLSQGVSSAREIVRRIETDFAFRWIVGDMTVCHDRLSRLRSDKRPELNALYSQVIEVLLFKGLISLDLAGQDGVRIRANAGAASFRSERGLDNCEQMATLHLQAVLAQQDDPELTPAQKARRLSAAKDYAARVAEAKLHLAAMPKSAAEETTPAPPATGANEPSASTKPAAEETTPPPVGARPPDASPTSRKPARKRGPKPSKTTGKKKRKSPAPRPRTPKRA